MEQINSLADQYHTRVTFAFMYILEAHAIDEWPVPCNNEDIPQHKSLLDRATAAKRLMAEFPLSPKIHLLLDNEWNDFNNLYSSWPFRFWVVRDNKIVLKLMPEGDKVSMEQLQNWLSANM